MEILESPRRPMSVIMLRLGQLLAVGTMLLWGAFFAHHVNEWFLKADAAPPPKVWVAMALHLGVMVGLLLILWRPWAGATLTVLATIGFFVTIEPNSFPWFALLNVPPILCLLFARRTRRN